MKTTLSEARLVTKFAFTGQPKGRKRANGALRALRGWNPSEDDLKARDWLLDAAASVWGPQARELSADTLLALIQVRVED